MEELLKMVAARKALLMGFGIQGQGALYDLIKFGRLDEIRVFDSRPDLDKALKKFDAGETALVPILGEVSDRPLLERAMQGVDVAICLLPRDFALPMAEMAVEAGVHYACASYMGGFCRDDESRARQARRMEKLDEQAKKKGLTVLTQFGLDPGLDLLLAGEAVRQFDKVDDFVSYGAGFPTLAAANNPLRYKFTWTVEGVMRSYYRPARVIRDGRVVDIAPGEIFFDENIHALSLDELGGTLECFPNGDSVSLAEELGIRDQVSSMGRYVCRWEGHCAFWRVMANCGFLDGDAVPVKGAQVDRISYISSLLASQPQFAYTGDEQDVTLTRVDVRGTKDGRKKREIYQIVDKKDLATGFTSMTRTVGFVVSLGAIMILDKLDGLDKKTGREGGVISPVEMPFEETTHRLGLRDIHITHRSEEL